MIEKFQQKRAMVGQRDFQKAGSTARWEAASKSILKAVKDLRAKYRRGEIPGPLTYADVEKVAGIDPKTRRAHVEELAEINSLLLETGGRLSCEAKKKSKQPTHYERASVNAQLAEAVCILKQAEIDNLQMELRAANERIAVLQKAPIQSRRTKRGNGQSMAQPVMGHS